MWGLLTKEGRRVWGCHVRATPNAMVPVLIEGRIPAWQIVPGPKREVLKHFRFVAPKTYWPSWVRKLAAGRS